MNDIAGDDHVLIREDLEAFLDDELDALRAQVVATHLGSCEPCRLELRSLEGLGRLLLANRTQIDPSADFERAFSAAFRREARGRRPLAQPAPVTMPEPRAEGAFAWLLRPVFVPLAVATAAAAATILLRPDGAVDVAAPIAPLAVESVAADATGALDPIAVAETEPVVEPALPAEPPPVIAEGTKSSTTAPALAVAKDADLVESASVESAAP